MEIPICPGVYIISPINSTPISTSTILFSLIVPQDGVGLDESLADYQKAVELDPIHVEANQALRRLPPKVGFLINLINGMK